jgi:glycosyltransferase involved in cell wall biosynthesis
MRICVVGYCHSISDIRIYAREASSLARAGHAVTVIAREQLGQRSTCRRTWQRPRAYRERQIDHIIMPPRPCSTLLRLLTEPLWFLRYLAALTRTPADAYHCHEPQSLFLGLLVTRFRKAHLIYDCHEYQPEAWAEFFPSVWRGHAFRVFRRLESMAAKTVSAVVTVNAQLVQRFQVDCTNVVEAPNYPLRETFEGISPRTGDPVRKLYRKQNLLLYHGSLFKERGLLTCVALMKSLIRCAPESALLIIGPPSDPTFMKELKEAIADPALAGSVTLLPWMSHEALIPYLCAADLGLFIPDPTFERYRYAEPVKYFECAACWTPMVLSDVPALNHLVSTTESGILVDPREMETTAAQVAAVLKDRELLGSMADSGRKAYEARFNWNTVEERLLALYKGLEEQGEKNRCGDA